MKIIRRLDEMLMDDIKNGKWSSNRFTFTFTVLFSNIIFWTIFLYLAISTHSFPEIPTTFVTIYGMANGFAFGGKAFQTQQEIKKILDKNGKCKDKEIIPEPKPPKPEI